MKYFTKEIIDKINSSNPEERAEGEIQWKGNVMEYNLLFMKMRERLPHTFLNAWDDYSGFHDFKVEQVLFEEHSQTIQLSLRKKEDSVSLFFIGCKNLYQTKMPYTSDILLYIELYDSEDYKIHILFSSDLEMVVMCKRIDVIINDINKEGEWVL